MELIHNLTIRASRSNEDVLSAVAKLRRDLDAVEHAVRNDLRVPGSVSGKSFAQSNAEDLADALRKRDFAFELLAVVNDAIKKVEAA